MNPFSFTKITLFGLLSAVALQAQVVVIVSAKNPITKLPPGELSQIFLGQTSTFFNGARVEPLDLPSSSPRTSTRMRPGRSPHAISASKASPAGCSGFES